MLSGLLMKCKTVVGCLCFCLLLVRTGSHVWVMCWQITQSCQSQMPVRISELNRQIIELTMFKIFLLLSLRTVDGELNVFSDALLIHSTSVFTKSMKLTLSCQTWTCRSNYMRVEKPLQCKQSRYWADVLLREWYCPSSFGHLNIPSFVQGSESMLPCGFIVICGWFKLQVCLLTVK